MTFLKTCCSLGAAGMATQIGRLGMVSAHAQPAADYKALVCIFMFGGNDSNNMIVPIDSRYGAYQTMRGPVALADRRAVAGRRHRLRTASVARQRAAALQRAARGAGLQRRHAGAPDDARRRSTARRCRRTSTHIRIRSSSGRRSDPNGGGTGWGGRINDLASALNTGPLPSGITVNGGNSLFLSGPVTKGLNFSNADSFGFNPFGDSTAMAARLGSLQKLLTFDSGLKLVSAANGVLGDSIKSAQEIEGALDSAPALPVAFPNSGLGQQLAQVAQIIAVRDALGMSRQIFFAGMGGFDNHENLLGNHARPDGDDRRARSARSRRRSNRVA